MLNNEKLIAKALYDFAKNSESEFVEVSADSELAKVASKFNIFVPNPDISILKTKYLKIGEVNKNGVLLSKDDVPHVKTYDDYNRFLEIDEVDNTSIEDAKKYLKKYDADKFEDALYDMIRHHDAEIGITWDTIDTYLDNDCLKDKS